MSQHFDTPEDFRSGMNESDRRALAEVTPGRGEIHCPDCFCYHHPKVECD